MTKPTDADIENRHGYHAPTPLKVEKHELVRQITEQAAKDIRDVAPSGRELSLALTKLDEARMWANAAIACNP